MKSTRAELQSAKVAQGESGCTVQISWLMLGAQSAREAAWPYILKCAARQPACPTGPTCLTCLQLPAHRSFEGGEVVAADGDGEAAQVGLAGAEEVKEGGEVLFWRQGGFGGPSPAQFADAARLMQSHPTGVAPPLRSSRTRRMASSRRSFMTGFKI